jgi:1,4-alpha-glucan branching enzyme
MARQMNTMSKQTFRFAAPAAMSVMLVGDFSHWQRNGIPMQRGKDGVWTASLELPPGTHHYRFIVDNEWCDDPDCMLRVPNPYGGHNMVRHVG